MSNVALSIVKDGELFKVRVQKFVDPSVSLGQFFGSVGWATYPRSGQVRLFRTEEDAQAYMNKRTKFDAIRKGKR